MSWEEQSFWSGISDLTFIYLFFFKKRVYKIYKTLQRNTPLWVDLYTYIQPERVRKDTEKRTQNTFPKRNLVLTEKQKQKQKTILLIWYKI